MKAIDDFCEECAKKAFTPEQKKDFDRQRDRSINTLLTRSLENTQNRANQKSKRKFKKLNKLERNFERFKNSLQIQKRKKREKINRRKRLELGARKLEETARRKGAKGFPPRQRGT